MAVWSNFTEFLDDTLIVELKRGFKPDSTYSLLGGLSVFRDQTNDVDAKTDYDTICTVLDKRTTQKAIDEGAGRGNVYKVYSDAYVAKYGLNNWWEREVDKVGTEEAIAKANGIGTEVGNAITAKLADGTLMSPSAVETKATELANTAITAKIESGELGNELFDAGTVVSVPDALSNNLESGAIETLFELKDKSGNLLKDTFISLYTSDKCDTKDLDAYGSVFISFPVKDLDIKNTKLGLTETTGVVTLINKKNGKQLILSAELPVKDQATIPNVVSQTFNTENGTIDIKFDAPVDTVSGIPRFEFLQQRPTDSVELAYSISDPVAIVVDKDDNTLMNLSPSTTKLGISAIEFMENMFDESPAIDNVLKTLTTQYVPVYGKDSGDIFGADSNYVMDGRTFDTTLFPYYASGENAGAFAITLHNKDTNEDKSITVTSERTSFNKGEYGIDLYKNVPVSVTASFTYPDPAIGTVTFPESGTALLLSKYLMDLTTYASATYIHDLSTISTSNTDSTSYGIKVDVTSMTTVPTDITVSTCKIGDVDITPTVTADTDTSGIWYLDYGSSTEQVADDVNTFLLHIVDSDDSDNVVVNLDGDADDAYMVVTTNSDNYCLQAGVTGGTPPAS